METGHNQGVRFTDFIGEEILEHITIVSRTQEEREYLETAISAFFMLGKMSIGRMRGHSPGVMKVSEEEGMVCVEADEGCTLFGIKHPSVDSANTYVREGFEVCDFSLNSCEYRVRFGPSRYA